MDFNEKAELFIIFKYLSKNSKELLNGKISSHKNIRLYVLEGLSRCERKDYGLKLSSANKVGFIDSDCTFKKDYLESVESYISKPIIRGRNIFVNDGKWLSKNNTIYRTLCDEVFFKNETFTPNLIIDKDLLLEAGGWSDENLDSQDDFILSQRLKRKYQLLTIFHAEEAVLFNNNQADAKIKKLIKTWYGYGIGYGFRLWRDEKPEISVFKKYIPPLVYSRKQSFSYLLFSIFQWFVTFSGYIYGIFRYKNKKVGINFYDKK
jgi:hypothetical protein